MLDSLLPRLHSKIFFGLAHGLCLVVLLSGCATANSTRNQLYSQTQQNRSLLRMEQQRSRDLLADRASLQRQIDQKVRQRDMLQLRDDVSSETDEEIAKLNMEIAGLKKAVLESTE